MAQEVIVRVRLDTSQAKRDMDEVNKEAKKTSEEVGGGMRTTLGRSFAMGAMFGTGIAAASAATRSGVMDLVSGPLDFLGQKLNDLTMGDSDDFGRATNRARDEAAALFAPVGMVNGGFPPEALSYFQENQARYYEQEKVKSMIYSDPAFTVMAGVAKDVDEAITDAKIGVQAGAAMATEFIKSIQEWSSEFFGSNR